MHSNLFNSGRVAYSRIINLACTSATMRAMTVTSVNDGGSRRDVWSVRQPQVLIQAIEGWQTPLSSQA